jgi:type-F conjugative transfer system secretin TraK
MVTNILRTKFKPTIFAIWFLLILLSSTVLAEDIGQKNVITEKIVASAITEDIKNTKNSTDKCDGIDTKKTKEGKRSAIDAAPFPKLVTKIVSAKDGATEKSFADNEQVKVVLSNRDINRILVTGDKIQSINGPAGLYTAKNDAVGSAYISLYGDTVFTVFASTLKGHNFSLLVTPREVAGRTVILEPTTPSLLTARFEETESYQKVLVGIISSMINNEDIEDYAYGEAKKPKKTDFYGIADIKPIAFYSGSHLLGIISEIKNKSKTPITLKPSYFYKPGMRAVALSSQTIAPSDTGLLYQIISR